VDDGNATVFHTIICNAISTLSVECPTDVTINPDVEPFKPGDVLTCSADGYNPTYTWTGTAANGAVTHIGRLYTLPEDVGVFDLTCTATVSEVTCTVTAEYSVTGAAIGNVEYNLIQCLQYS